MVSPGNGHALICVGPDDVGDPPMPEIEAYERDDRRRRSASASGRAPI